MDMNKITQMLQEEGNIAAEIVVYSKTDNGVVRKTTTIQYYQDNDYQWSTSTWPIVAK
jgi:hypothetical protein